MSLERWAPISPELAELQARCLLCGLWMPFTECIEWQNALAMQYCYCCIDCLSDPFQEATMRMYGWMRTS